MPGQQESKLMSNDMDCPIERSGLNASAWWALGPLARLFPALVAGIPRRCVA
jgi:hypothetical protein